MVISASTGLLLVVLAIGFTGALLGTAGYAATVGRRQMRRIAGLTELLIMTTDATNALDTSKLEDPRLRAAFEHLAERMSQAWTLATVDMLTGVLNRQALLSRLDDELERAARYQRPCSVVLVDLDHFKRVNDTHGHAAGDLVLREVADVLRTHVRTTDIVGRYGGEEFMVVLPETDADAAAVSAEKLRRLVGSREVRLDDGHVLAVSLSAGVAGGLGQHLKLDSLIRDADAALYSAKALGRDQVYVFHELEEGSIIRRAAIGPEARDRAVAVGRTAMSAATTALTEALVARPSWAGKPSTMIAEMAVSLARALDLPAGEVERVRTASLLHDLGKLAIPDEILSNPGELTDPEWRVVSEHPKIGQIVLEQAGALRDAATIVLHHHEWYDGRGYPHGLTGQEIPVGARIVAIADAYEAMVAGRPYRTAIDHERALAELRRHAGVQFDPELVGLFAVLFADGVPWEPGQRDFADGHRHPHALVADGRSHAQIHDDLHARRRKAVPTERSVASVASVAPDEEVAAAAVVADSNQGSTRPGHLHSGTMG
jgi:diguanylate cyclase (GGDEF)-like protein